MTTRFLRKNYLTARRAAALEVLGAEALSPESFVKKMWPRGVSIGFGAYFLGGMIGLGLIEKSVQEGYETYQVTEEGRGLLAQPPWKCWYCGASAWKPGVTVRQRPCRACKGSHRACKECIRKRVVADGDFPAYRAALRDCPPGERP